MAKLADRVPAPRGRDRRSRGLAAVALATAATATSGHTVTGPLPVLAVEPHASPGAVGQLATFSAVVCVLAGPALAVATGRWERRTLLTVTLLVTAAGNVMAAVSTSYWTLVAGRMVTALGAATTTAVAVGLAAAASPPAARARTMSLVLTGVTAALLLGVPGVAAMAYWWGYRPAVWAVVGLCLIAAAVVIGAPRLPAPPALRLADRLAAATRPGVGGVLIGAALTWTSIGVGYPYLALVVGTSQAAHGPASLYLTFYGLGAAASTVWVPKLLDHTSPRGVLVCAALVTALAAAVLMPSVTHPVFVIATVTAWGASAWVTAPAANAWLTDIADGDRGQSGLLLALAGAVIYLGLGVGGLLGGAALTWGGTRALLGVAAVLAVLAAAVFAAVGRGQGGWPTPNPGPAAQPPPPGLHPHPHWLPR
ncbi:Predicted arabinose efflux permease, MFS family [Actinokineospora iranica]|uniref:Predicted arabinose efflux permease, MFS family n=2 Tax=Actinokineospora iranica TaxID=1271860 RepID=A0A1G6VSR0_9PSEU|nr:Predicted arabinose efflux permease, MFS family [Actinokineospora iranica]